MTNSGLPQTHPGELRDELLLEMRVPQAEFGRAVDITPDRLSAVIRGEQPITAESALLFARALDQSPHDWLNLQAEYDLRVGACGPAAAALAPLRVKSRPRDQAPTTAHPHVPVPSCRRERSRTIRRFSSRTDRLDQSLLAEQLRGARSDRRIAGETRGRAPA